MLGRSVEEETSLDSKEFHDNSKSSDESVAELFHTTQQRRLAVQNRQRRKLWEKELEEARYRTPRDFLETQYGRLPTWIRKIAWLTIPFLLCTALFVTWIILEFGVHTIWWRNIRLAVFFRILFSVACILVLVGIYVTFMGWSIENLAQQRVVLDMKPFKLSITLLLWAVFSLVSYQWIAGRELPTSCDSDDSDISTNAPWQSACFTFQWAFVAALVVAILWLLRSIGEEILLSKMSIRPTNENIQIGLLQERVLYQITHYGRTKGIIPKKNNPENVIPDLSLPLRSNNEAKMLSILEEKVYYGLFNHNLERDGLILLGLREQASQLFDAIASSKDAMVESDFSCITSSKDNQRRMFTALNYSLSSRISREDFVAAVESIYTGRKKIWSSYLDRKKLADIMRTIFGIAFWIIAIVIVLLIAEVSFSTAILPLSSFVLGFSFAFKGIIALMVESFVLMLIVRPFDVGDIISIGFINPDRMEVINIGLFRTLFRRTDGKFISVANQELISTSILNLTRSDAYIFWIPVVLSFNGRISSIIALKQAMEKYIKENPDLTDGGCWVERIPQSNNLKFYHCGVAPRVSWARRRAQEEIKLEFILHMQKVAKKLGIELKSPIQPIEMIDSAPEKEHNPKGQVDTPQIRQRKMTQPKRDSFV